MFKELRIKLFGRTKKEIYNNMHSTLGGISSDLKDIRIDIKDVHIHVQECLILALKIQKQCEELCRMVDKMNAKDNAIATGCNNRVAG